jgi:crossover junction endodeoxyribonuclease RuvC
MTILGIDPGVSGALVLRTPDSLVIRDMPVVEVRGKRSICPAQLTRLLKQDFSGMGHVVLEHVQGVQGSGATSAFSFGRGFGVVEGVVAALGIPLTLVRPQTWTKALGVSRDKGSHRLAAARIWPQHAEYFARAKDDGRADAALLCHWYMRHANG